jgi:prevent-host-death family protein
MSTLTGRTRTVSVTEAAARGVAGLVKDAEAGEDLVVARHGTAVAAVISVDHFARITEVEEDLRDAALVLARSATGSGARTSLDEALAMFGLERAELEAELASDLAAGRG